MNEPSTCHSLDEIGYLAGVIDSLRVTGDAAEIGVWNGYTAKQIHGHATGKVHLFDTFGGIMEEHAEPGWKPGLYRCTQQEVRGFIGDDFIFHEGDICQTKFEVEDNEFVFVHIDLDVYAPLKDCLPYFYRRLIRGGAMLISNYDTAHPGVMKAVEETFKVDKTFSRYVLIKK